MPSLRVPSVQHLARNWKSHPDLIAKALVRLALNPPIFNYNPLYSAIRDLLVLGVPYDQVFEGVKRIKRQQVRENLLEVLPLIRDHFFGISPDYFQTIEKRYYPVARNLMVPFEPPMVYGVGGQLYFPWFSFWRQNPLRNEPLSLFVTMVDDIVLQDPDLENARFEILDFSCPQPGKGRVLRVIDAQEIPRVSSARKLEMLEVFAAGFSKALEQLSKRPEGRQESESPQPNDPNQPGFFD